MTAEQKFELLPHTADLRMKVRGRTLAELFSNALAGFASIVGEGVERGEAVAPQEVHLEADSASNLLVEFLNEALYLVNVNKAVYDRVAFTEFSETAMRGTLRGYTVDGFAEDVKAVTYHGVAIGQDGRGNVEAELIFDI